jgi:hypothetical protein
LRNITAFEDLLTLEHDDQCVVFVVSPYSLVNENFFVLSDGEESAVFCLKISDTCFIMLVYRHNTKQINFKEFHSDDECTVVYRKESLPTTIHYDEKGNIKIKEWFYKIGWGRDNRFTPSKIDYMFKLHKIKNLHMFTYSRVNKKEMDKDLNYNNVFINYIIYNTAIDSVIDASFHYCGKKLNLREMSEHFPNLVNMNLDDCYDMSKRIFTDDLVILVDMMNI